ncbi:fructosamine kinase family protein [Nocardioides rotundus]|uniref:fructosamine kinase family protein n=1 Tax=Nocardioides rotundus TaxID=1774216 RepID=UPI001CBFA102|nr:fructosamine kinase family protein [Nocardioides rotundus]UAL30146.1 fructosamine kinase family protein [Nocardioides rotundus]
MTRQPLVARRAEELLGHAVVATAPVAGGDIATATKLRLSDGTIALMKTLTHPPEGFFESEARGLGFLAEAGPDGVPVGEVLAVEPDCLILRWVEQGRSTAEAAGDLGRSLAATHAVRPASYGADQDGFVGRLPLPNRTAPTWAEFYATRRVLPYLKLAADRGSASPEQVAAVEAVVGRLPDLVPEEGPARIHGDLWNGNVLWGLEGRCHLIDPAAHGGHRETDLAMLALFGLPHLTKVTEAYDEAAPLTEGWEDRLGLHQLHPLLVHACLFGGSYAERAAQVASRYVG